MPEQAELPWRTSRKSNGGNCVEVAVVGDSVLVRNSKDPDGPMVRFTRSEWGVFLSDVADDPSSWSD